MIGDPHLARLHRALKDEERAEAAEFARLDALPGPERVALGHAWPPLRVRAVERWGRTVAVTCQAPRGVVLHDGIAAGDAVWLAVHGQDLPATVEGVDPGAVELRVDGPEPPEGAPAEIRRRHDPSTFVRYRQALERADAHASPLKDVLLGERPPSPPTAGRALPGLNDAQRAAAAHVLGAPELALVHGPPGTGKTVLLGAVLEALVADGERPWALADSNAAVDHLSLTARGRGLDVVRLGPYARFRPEVQELALDVRVARGPFGPKLADLDRALKRAWGTPEAWKLRAERDEVRALARAHAIGTADVVASTFGTLARVASTLPKARTAVVDEATQAVEPAVWAAVPFVERLVLVGDPRQLGPVVRVPGTPLEVSLLERLVQGGHALPMLTVQHRMARPIRELVDDVYGPTYVDAPSVPRAEDAVRFVDTAGQGAEARDPATGSWFEPSEIEVVAGAVTGLVAEGFRPEDIAVITPYSAQVARLRDRAELAGVAVGTVNAWQGREARAVVVSFVRSNPDGELGFLRDERRLTVSLTRARERLVLVGDTGTLARHPRYRRLIDRLADAGALVSVWELP